MYVLITICIFLILVFASQNLSRTLERFDVLHKDVVDYDVYLLTEREKAELGEQRYLTFLTDVNNSWKSKVPKTGPFRGSCDDKVNERIQNEALKEAYTKLDSLSLSQQFSRDPCIAYANYLCEFTDPNMYIVNSLFPPRWLVKTYSSQALPKQTYLSCFNQNYDCCKSSGLETLNK